MHKIMLLLALLAGFVSAQVDTCDWLWVHIKIGDQRTATGKGYLGVKDGMVVDYIDPDDPNYGRDYFPSEWMRTVFLNVKIPDSYENNLQNWIMPVGVVGDSIPDTTQYRARRRLIRFGEFPAEAQNKIRNALDNGKVLDLTQQYAAWLFPDGTRQESSNWTSNAVKQLFVSSSVLNPPTVDENSISSGSYTVGSGGDYATWALFGSDVANLTGNLTGSQISATTESARLTISIDVSTYTINVTSNTDPQGSYTGGHLTVINHSGHFALFNGTGSGTICFEKLVLRRDVDGASAAIQVNTAFTGTAITRNLVSNGNSYGSYGIRILASNSTIFVYNCIIFNVDGPGVVLDGDPDTCQIENVTCYGNTIGFDLGNYAGTRMVNTAAYGNGTDYLAYTDVDGSSLASDDATAFGPDSVVNGVPADDFESLDSSNALYLVPKATGALYGVGANVEIGGHTTYINGVTIVTDDVDIGAKGLTRATGPTITTHPADSTVNEQNAVSFYIEATSSGGTMSFQWQRHAGSWSNESGATDSTLSFTATLAMNGDSLRCIVTDDNGSDTSNAALLTVNDLSPTVDTDPVADTVVEGATASYFIEASLGAGTALTFQWQRYGGSSWANESGATDSTLSFVTTGSMDGDSLRCIVNDGYGADTSAGALLNVLLVPSIASISPTHGTYLGGDTISITGTQFGDSAATSAAMFGDSTTTLYTWTDTEVLAIIKAGSGTVSVSLTNNEDQSDTLADAYTYDPKPVVDSISPTGGNRNQTHTVTIYGSGFLGTQGTGYAAIEDPESTLTITSWSATSITGTARTGTAGAQSVFVFNSNADGDTLATAFTFDSIPVILSITPAVGDTAGGDTVTLAGFDFEADQGTGTVTFGGTEATSYESWATGEVVVITPAGTGSVDVILTNNTGDADTTTFTYTSPGTTNWAKKQVFQWMSSWMQWSRRFRRHQ